ncbi:hypothetical protein GCM10027399_08970 [Curvibacter fontanus]
MCYLPLATLAISAYTAMQTHNNQQDAANKLGEAIKQTRDAARMDAEREQQQAAEAAAGEANAHSLQALKDMAAFDAVAGESGGGVSSQRGGAAIGIQNGQDLATVRSNAQRTQAEIAMGDLAAGSRAQQQMASIQRPSAIGTYLTIAGHGVDYMKARAKERNGTGERKAD